MPVFSLYSSNFKGGSAKVVLSFQSSYGLSVKIGNHLQLCNYLTLCVTPEAPNESGFQGTTNEMIIEVLRPKPTFWQNLILPEKKIKIPIVFPRTCVLLRGFLKKECPMVTKNLAKRGKRALKTKHHFVLWLISVVSNKLSALW